MKHNNISYGSLQELNPQKSQLINFEKIILNEDLEEVADKFIETTFIEDLFMRKDAIDRFLDFTFFKLKTGTYEIFHMAYPIKRMHDKELEEKIIKLINELLYPEIVLRILKFFTRNIHDSDSNISLANLISNEAIIRSIYETFNLFKKDIFEYDLEKKCLNVKRVQQFSAQSDISLSLPLDACARLKYILEFFLEKYDMSHIYSKSDILMLGTSDIEEN